MPFLRHWLRQPQTVWLRRALFQVHMWTGLALGIYLVLISISGSALVFRNELFTYFTRPPVVVSPAGEKLSEEALRAAVEEQNAGYRVNSVFTGRLEDQAVEVWLDGPDGRRQRLFHPYTAEDLGEAVPPGIRFVSWLLDLHDNLLFGETGRKVNGYLGLLFTILVATGLVVWWPGVRNWRRSLMVQWNTNWKRFNWSLHSAIGFWAFLFLFIWGVSGVYLVFPDVFAGFVDYVDPLEDDEFDLRPGDTALLWLSRLHFGRFAGTWVKVAWTVIGVVPAVLFVTGAFMWWNRAVRPAGRQEQGRS